MATPSWLPKVRELAIHAAKESGADESIVDSFMVEVESAWRAMMNRMDRASRPQKVLSRITRGRAVAAACDALNMDPPRRGKKINMRKARSQKRLLIRSFHPDLGTGDRDRLAEVIAAYETLDHYSKMENGQ